MIDIDLKKEIQIDPYALDEECLEQGRKIIRVAELYSKAVQDRDRAKLSLEVITANLTLKIKKEYQTYGFDSKPSDAMANAAVMIQPKYIRARHKFIDLNRDCELLKPGIEAFKDRSIQIGRLINLVLTGYSGGKVHLSEEASEAVDKTRTERQTESLNKNARLQRLRRSE
jgi:hypothetical protein